MCYSAQSINHNDHFCDPIYTHGIVDGTGDWDTVRQKVHLPKITPVPQRNECLKEMEDDTLIGMIYFMPQTHLQLFKELNTNTLHLVPYNVLLN